MKQLMTILLALTLALAACGPAAAEQTARRVETAGDADAFIAAFFGAHPEEMEGRWAFTPQMDTALAQLGGIVGLARQLSVLGAFRSALPAYEGAVAGFRTFHIPCAFSLARVDLILAVQDGAVAGLQTAPYTGAPADEGGASYDSVGLALPVPALGELPGLLTVPRGEGPFPAVILLQGSGPSDRDEAMGKLKPFRDLAEGLAEQGVAVYRFDKRTYVYGAALAADTHFTLEDEYVEDAVNAVQLLARQERIDPGRIYVLGHSLGGNAIPAVARALESAPVRARGFMMLAASPRSLDTLMREQYDFLYALTPDITAEQQAEKDRVFAELDRLVDLDALAADDAVLGVYPAYWKWLADYDILAAARAVVQPVLLLQGEEDYQVTLEDFGIWQAALGGRENWTMISYPGLTHAFTPGQKTEGAAAYARAEHVSPRVIRDIADFVARTGTAP